MGTFHDNLGSLHGITVVVDTTGDTILVGRCHEANDQFVLILDADEHRQGDQNLTKQQWVSRAARWGVFTKHKVLKIPRDQIASVTPLNQIEPA